MLLTYKLVHDYYQAKVNGVTNTEQGERFYKLASKYDSFIRKYAKTLNEAQTRSRVHLEACGLPLSSGWGVAFGGWVMQPDRLHTSAIVMHNWARGEFNPFDLAPEEKGG